ncbi:helix-turn-helix domain-containing protein [Novosphingobium sp. ZW T3_23]|uniref:helix-turn-helix domain-containing protein n=1 Tax=Novosphingobium sp. ZW T3_23 TaxID=3378084 RepID=UPI00385238D2
MHRGWVISPDYRTLISALSAVRQELRISQRELARRVGKPPSFINKIELLERRLDVQEFIVIAEALGQEPGLLLQTMRDQLGENPSI